MRRTFSLVLSCLLAGGLLTAPFAAPAAAEDAAPTTTEGWTRTSHWQRLPDGRVRVDAYAGPVFAKRGARWIPVDARLSDTRDPAAPFAAPNALVPVSFGASAARVVHLDLPKGPVRLTAPGLRIGPPERTGNVVTYRDVATDTDLVVEVSARGLRTQFVLRSAAAPTAFQLRLEDPSGQLGDVHETAEGFEFTRRVDGDLVLNVARGFAYESSAVADGQPVGSEAGTAHLSIRKDGSGFVLDKRVDPEWLRGKTFPVVLDPEVYLEGADVTTDCHIVSGSKADTNYCPGSTFEIGYHSDTLVRRALLKFALPPLEQNATVDLGELYLVTDAPSTSTTTSPVFDVYEVNAAWSTNVTWNRRFATANWGTPGGTYFTGSRGNATMERGEKDATKFTLTASMIQKWATTPSTNLGVLVRARNEGAQSLIRFGSSDHVAQEMWPLLRYETTDPPSAPYDVEVPTSGIGRGSARVEWSKPATTDPIAKYLVNAVCQSDGCPVETAVFECWDPCTSRTVEVAGGHSYVFEVRAQDTKGRTGPPGTSPSTFIPPANKAPYEPDELAPASGSKMRSAPNECGRYRDPDGDPGTLLVDIRRADTNTTVATNLSTLALTSNSTGCVGTPLGDGIYEWDAIASDGLLLSPRTPEQTFLVDGTPPAPPVVTSDSHGDQNAWSRDPAVELAIAADDLSGIDGHSWTRDTSIGTLPDEIVDLRTPTLRLTVPDGDQYVHVRSCNNTALCSAVTDYRVRVDTVRPAALTASSSHTVGSWSNDGTIDMWWNEPFDATSGVLGYRTLFSRNATDTPIAAPLLTSRSAQSPTLTDGDWWFHAVAVDRAGNVSDIVRRGPFKIDVTAPSVLSVSSSSHTGSLWSEKNPVTFVWSAADATDVVGYSWTLNSSSTTPPDLTPDGLATETTLTVPDGVSYFHVRALDRAGNWSATKTFSVRVDTTPALIDSLTSSSHPSESTWYGTGPSASTPSFSWAASDVSGIVGYSYALDQSPTTVPDGVSEGTQTTFSKTVADGVWYFHVRPINGSGLVGATVRRKVMVDVTAPAAPVVGSAHNSAVWSKTRDVTFSWTPVSDVSNVVGYAVVFDQTLDTVPPLTATNPATTRTFTNVADGTWYAHVRAVNGSGLGSVTTTYRVLIDGTGAALTTLRSTTHADPTKWYGADDVTVEYDATDLSGIAGYSYVVDQLPQTIPDAVIDDVSTKSATFSNLPDGVWYVHVVAINGAGVFGVPSTIKVLVDDTAPTTTTVTSPDHPAGMTTNQRVVTLDWSAVPGTDAMSGIGGYHVTFTPTALALTDRPGVPTTTATTFSSPALADGTWYAHVRALDKALNVGADYVYGPIYIDPLGKPVSDAERDRFIALWKPRVTSDTYGKPYLDSPGYPTSILLEGFHGYNPVQKGYLVDELWATLIVDYPIPDAQAATERAMRDEVYDFVFAKEKFLIPPANAEIVEDALRVVLPEVPVLQPLLDLLDLRAGRTVEIPTLDVTTLPDLGTEEVLSGVDDTLEPLTEDATAILSAETEAMLGYLQNQLHDTLDEIGDDVAKVVAQTVPLDPREVFAIADLLPVDAGYTVCFTYGARSGCERAAALFLPVHVDLSGDGTPDVVATLAPTVDVQNAVGVGFGWQVIRATTPHDLDGKALKAHVWAEYDVPLYNTRFSIGFDGSRGRLSNVESYMVLAMTDPARLQQRDLLANYSITHTETSRVDEWAATLGVKRITGDADPTTARIAWTPPGNARGELVLINDDTDTARDRTTKFTSDMTSGIRSKLRIDGREVVAARSERTDVAVQIPTLEKQTSLTLRDKATGGDDRELSLDFTASERTAEVSANAQIQRGSERLGAFATLKDVPKRMSYDLTNRNGDGHHVYSADGELGSVAAAVEMFTGATRHGTAVLQAAGVPLSMDLRHTPDPADRETILVDYSAASDLDEVKVSGWYRPEALSLNLVVQNVPVVLSGTVDTQLKHVTFDAITPIKLIEARVSRKTTKVSRLAGEHATIITPAAGTFGLSVRVTGLTSATLDMGDVMNAQLTVLPGGQKFSIGGQIASVYFSADVSNLPARLQLELDRVNLRMYYNGSATVPRIRGYAGVRPGGPHVEATLTQVPTEVTVQATPGSTTGVLTYNANAPLGSIERIVATSDGVAGDKKGTTIQGAIKQLPRTATLSVDRSLRLFSFEAEQAVGEVDITMSRNGARPQRTTKNHLTLTGTTTAWALGVRLPNVRTATLDMRQGLAHSSGSLTMSVAGQEFVANGNLDGVRFYASLSNLPTSFSYAANGTQQLTYSTSTPIETLALYVAKTGTGPTLRGTFTAAPSTGTVTASLAKPKYSLRFEGSAPMRGASGYYSSRYVDSAASATTDFVAGSVKGLPRWFDVQLDTAISQVSFSSDRAMDEVQARAKGLLVDGLNAEALLRDLPANAHVHYDINDVLFDGLGGTIGYAFARGSNYAAPPKRLPGRHVYLRADLPRKLFDASAELTNVGTVKVKRTGADLELVGNVDIGTSKLELDLQADFYPPGTSSGTAARVLVDGSVVGFPSNLKVERIGDVVTYHADRNLTANLEVAAGYPFALTHAKPPKARNGISVTDGACTPGEGCPTERPDGTERLFCQSDRDRCLGFRARIDYAGLPTDMTLRLDPQNNVFVTTSALMPTSSRFEARADLRYFTPWAVEIDAGIGGVLPGTTLAVGPVKLGKFDATGGAHIHAKMSSNRDLGGLDMRVRTDAVFDVGNYRYRDFDVSAEIARVPKEFDATVELGYQSRLKVRASSPILGRAIEVHAYATVQEKDNIPGTFRTLAERADAALLIDDVPGSPTEYTDLAIRMPAPDGTVGPVVLPGLVYSAPDNTLDGAVTIHPAWGRLLVPLGTGIAHGDLIRAKVEFNDLSKQFSVVIDPRDYTIAVAAGAGLPATKKLSAQILGLDANLDMGVNIDKTWKGLRVRINAVVDARAQIDITRVDLLNVKRFDVRPGKFKAAYGISGDYEKFQVHAENVNLDFEMDAIVRLRPSPLWSWAPDLFATPVWYTLENHNRFVTHVYEADLYGRVGGCVQASGMSAQLYMRPGPRQYQQNSVVLNGTDGRRKVITFVDPRTSDVVSNVIDILVPTVEDPYENGDWYIDTAWGSAACT